MLKQRILTALILGPLIIWSVLAFSHKALAIEMGLVLMLAGWEWARLAGIQKQPGRVIYAFVVGSFLLMLTWLIHSHVNLLKPILYTASAWWVVATLLIIVANRKKIIATDNVSLSAMLLNLLVGILILSGAFIGIVAMHSVGGYGENYILILLILIWVADSSAYFAGKAFGKHKLAANVSPGKTWEGVMGGMLATILVAYIIGLYLKFDSALIFYFVVTAVVSIGFSIVGDLIESLFKRRTGVKDSSQLLPGHGGILDRIDSLLSAAPLFLLGLLLVGIK